MRFNITIITNETLSLPIEMREYLTAAIYSLIEKADPDYARFLHDEGYDAGDGTGQRYKLFTYAPLRAPASRRALDKAHHRIIFKPGPISFLIASPVEEFIRNVAGGLLAEGYLQIATARLPVTEIQVLPQPNFSEKMCFTCLSPIIASRPIAKADGGGTHFIRPMDEPEAFSEIIRKNLIAKYRTLHRADPADTHFEMVFDANYLARHKGGTKLTRFKDIRMLGILAPFTAKGSVEIMELAYNAGIGSKGSQGHGMVEVLG